MLLSSLMAVPARRIWQTKNTVSGEVINTYQSGDEYVHYWVTKEGKIALPQPDGTFLVTNEPQPTAEEIAARRAASPLYVRNATKVGTINLAPRGLVILVSYSDLAFEAKNTQEAMSEMMNKEGYDYNGATGSAADYFKAQSNGQYTPVFDVVGPVTLPHERAYYGGNSGNSDKNAAQMIVDACMAVDDEVDFTLYDNNGDNQIDFVYVLFAGIGENDKGGEADAIWPHNSYAGWKNCYLDGKKLNNYACSGEIDGVTKDRSGIGVLCHEFGHVIGLPDYYDADGNSNGNTTNLTPNEWSIMDYGCYNNDVNTPPDYSIFDKYWMGWATPEVLAKDAQENVTLGTGYTEGYQINGGTSLLPYSTSQTVYYIENRQQEGWDYGLYAHGLIVWKVQYSSSAWSSNKVNNNINTIRYTIIPSDGGTMVGWVQNNKHEDLHKSTGDPFPGADEVTEYTFAEGCAMTAIEEKDGVVRFKWNGGSEETDVENPETDKQQLNAKRLVNGQLFIQRGEQLFTITGQQIQ